MSRMGWGKGKVDFHIAPVRCGQILYEIYCLNHAQAYEASLKAIHKLPIKIKIEKKI
jgi:large subunit ribosomal protein L16